MIFIYDNLTASILAATVVLILTSVQMRTTELRANQSFRNSALKQAKTFATWIEEDLESMGRHVDDGETVFAVEDRISNAQSPTDSTLKGLTFYYRNAEGGSKTTLDYEISATNTLSVDGTKRTLYELTRQKGGIKSGGSPATLGYFDLHFIGPTAERVSSPAANREKIEALRVHFSVVPSVQNDETTLHEIHRMVVVPYTPALE